LHEREHRFLTVPSVASRSFASSSRIEATKQNVSGRSRVTDGYQVAARIEAARLRVVLRKALRGKPTFREIKCYLILVGDRITLRC